MKKLIVYSAILGLIGSGVWFFAGDHIMKTTYGREALHHYKLRYAYMHRFENYVKAAITGESVAEIKEIASSVVEAKNMIQEGVSLPEGVSFPDMGSGSTEEYLKKTRDALRIMHVKEIATALSVYYIDHGNFPESLNGCINDGALGNSHFEDGKIPTDPVPGRKSIGCAGSHDMTYIYKTGNKASGDEYYAIGFETESETSGNSSLSVDALSFESFKKEGSGKMYYVVQ